jgi:hypothetical protein
VVLFVGERTLAPGRPTPGLGIPPSSEARDRRSWPSPGLPQRQVAVGKAQRVPQGRTADAAYSPAARRRPSKRSGSPPPSQRASSRSRWARSSAGPRRRSWARSDAERPGCNRGRDRNRPIPAAGNPRNRRRRNARSRSRLAPWRYPPRRNRSLRRRPTETTRLFRHLLYVRIEMLDDLAGPPAAADEQSLLRAGGGHVDQRLLPIDNRAPDRRVGRVLKHPLRRD